MEKRLQRLMECNDRSGSAQRCDGATIRELHRDWNRDRKLPDDLVQKTVKRGFVVNSAGMPLARQMTFLCSVTRLRI